MRVKLKKAERHEEIIKINTDFIKLGSLLKFAGIVETGSHAKRMIEEKRVRVNGEICTARGKKIKGGDTVSVKETDLKVIYEN